jgi:hypothetical protein
MSLNIIHYGCHRVDDEAYHVEILLMLVGLLIIAVSLVIIYSPLSNVSFAYDTAGEYAIPIFFAGIGFLILSLIPPASNDQSGQKERLNNHK